MDSWINVVKGPVSLHVSYGTTDINNLTASNIRVRTVPTFTLFLDLDRNLRVRDKQSNAASDAEEFASEGCNELVLVQLISEDVVNRLGKILRTIRHPPREWLLTINLRGERTFTVRPEPDQDRSSLFLHVLRPKSDQEGQVLEDGSYQ